MDEAERLALEAETARLEAKLADGERWRYICRTCGKTPADIGWCDECGYNRNYEKSLKVVMQ